MKTIIRKDGQKFIVTNALYEEAKKKGLFEDLFDGKLEEPAEQSVSKDLKQNPVNSKNSQNISPDEKAKNFLNKLLKRTNSGAYQMVLPLDRRAAYANEIRNGLKDLVEIYKIYTHGGIYDNPYVVVFSSEKFQTNIFKKWEKIASLMNAKDGRILSDKEIQLISSVNLSIPPRQAMQEDIKKIYNL